MQTQLQNVLEIGQMCSPLCYVKHTLPTLMVGGMRKPGHAQLFPLSLPFLFHASPSFRRVVQVRRLCFSGNFHFIQFKTELNLQIN